MNKTVKILKKAKAILLKYDWTQGVAMREKNGEPTTQNLNKNTRLTPGCSLCLAGVLTVAGATDDEWPDCKSELLETLKEPNYYSIVLWNDAKSRTKKQVLALLDKTVARLEKAAP